MWIKTNANPLGKHVPDCVVRAICTALDQGWHETYWDICEVGARDCNMPSANSVWGKYLYEKGLEPFLLPESCPECVTVKAFCKLYRRGTYIIGTGDHAVAIRDGDYFDSFDSGDEIPSYFWRLKPRR